MYSNVYDDVIDFEVCIFVKNTNIWVSWEQSIISSNKKTLSLYMKCYSMVKYSFPEATAFKVTFPFPYSLNISENQIFSDVFKG